MSLPVGKGYCDLNIPSDSNYQEVIKRALRLGYQTLAINVKVHQNQLLFKSRQNKKAKLEVPNQILDFPEAPKVDLEPSDYPELSASGKSPAILKRLTITFHNNDFLPFLSNSENVKDYDLIAILPESTIGNVQLFSKWPLKSNLLLVLQLYKICSKAIPSKVTSYASIRNKSKTFYGTENCTWKWSVVITTLRFPTLLVFETRLSGEELLRKLILTMQLENPSRYSSVPMLPTR